MMKSLLVTGASGFLGWNVCRAAAAAGWKVTGAYRSHPLSINNVETIGLDLTDHGAVSRAVAPLRPDAVIHCAAEPNPNACEEKPALSRRINVEASIILAETCRRQGVQLVFTSTDLVFDGEHAPYGENDLPGPISVYGNQKVEAEQGMRQAHPGVTVCRVPVMFGDPGPCSKSFIQPLLKNLRQGVAIRLFSDEIRTTVSGKTAAQGLLLCIGKPGETFHLGGRQRISRYDFGLLLCRAIGAPESLCVPVLQKDAIATAPSAAPRPRDVSLTSDKAFAMGYDPRPLPKQLSELDCIREYSRPRRSRDITE
jgi:dTDP-4-dehydrorhamnose reductase